MREHKFRGKAKTTGEWVYGCLVIFNDGTCEIITESERKLSHYVDGKPFYSIYKKAYEVDPDTVGQYTEMSDKNGKESYEHDIIKVYVHNGLYPDEWIAEIVFEKGQFGIRYGDLYKEFYPLSAFYRPTKTKYISNVGEVTIESESTFEVIGNVWDNPELLKEVE